MEQPAPVPQVKHRETALNLRLVRMEMVESVADV